METGLKTPQDLFVQPVRYEIPAFQRRYVWDEEAQWEPLWNDVQEISHSILDGDRKEPHFMGAIVLQQMRSATGTIGRRIVVDGQQRLTTLQLLIDAVQEVLEDHGHSDPAKRLGRLVLNPEEYCQRERDHVFKVWPTNVDQAAFRHAMSNALSATDYADSRIAQAHRYFRSQAELWLDDSKDRETAAEALEAAASRCLSIVVIDLGDSDDPHVIFETLNARGTPLLQSDMVKNKILYDAGVAVSDDGSEASVAARIWPFDQDWWAADVGRGLQRRPRIDVYLNHWLTLRTRTETKPRNEFSVFDKYARRMKTEGRTVEDVARDISRVGDIYRDVEQEDPQTGISRFLERRRVMNVGVITPLLLWLLDAKLSPSRLTNCICALESFLVRRVVCGLSARSYGELFVALIQKLSEDSSHRADQTLVAHLADQKSQAARWPTNQELQERMVTAPLYRYLRPGRLGMVLEAIEERLRTNMAESRQVPSNLHIEHIMPQSWYENWPLGVDAGEKDEDATVYRNRAIHTIGNLTLVNMQLNSSLSNAPWERKRRALADHSTLHLNKRLVNDGPAEWNEGAIEDRARWLHRTAVEIWPHGSDIKLAS